jgi:hypothetical protein
MYNAKTKKKGAEAPLPSSKCLIYQDEPGEPNIPNGSLQPKL